MISPLERPSARRVATSRSWGVRGVGSAGGVGGGSVAEAAEEGGGLVAAPAGPAVEQAGGPAGVAGGALLVAEGEQAAGGALVAVGQQERGPVELVVVEHLPVDVQGGGRVALGLQEGRGRSGAGSGGRRRRGRWGRPRPAATAPRPEAGRPATRPPGRGGCGSPGLGLQPVQGGAGGRPRRRARTASRRPRAAAIRRRTAHSQAVS